MFCLFAFSGSFFRGVYLPPRAPLAARRLHVVLLGLPARRERGRRACLRFALAVSCAAVRVTSQPHAQGAQSADAFRAVARNTLQPGARRVSRASRAAQEITSSRNSNSNNQNSKHSRKRTSTTKKATTAAATDGAAAFRHPIRLGLSFPLPFSETKRRRR